MITLQTTEILSLITTVIVHREVFLSELKNSAMHANHVPKDRLLTLKPDNANKQLPKEQDANAMSNTMILETPVSPVLVAHFQGTLMEQNLKPIKMKHQDAKHSCHGKSILTPLLIKTQETLTNEMVLLLMRKLNMTAMPKIHTLELSKIATDAIHVEQTRLLTEQITDVHK